jgi:DNA polymerase-3 subunit delta
MVITLTGANSFLLRRELKQLTNDFLAVHGDMGLERIEGDEVDFGRISEALTSLPFLATKKMVVLRGASANKQFVEQSEKLLSELPETTDLIIVEPKLDKRLAYYKYLKKSTDFQEYNELDQNSLVNWLVATAKGQGGSISTSDARYLVERTGANQRLLGNELEKLLLYEPKVTPGTIELLTEPTPQSTIFQLLEAAFAGNTKRALDLYAEQRGLKVETPQIIAMLAWQLNILAIVKTAGDRSLDQIATEAKLSPYVVQKSATIAGKMTLAKLKSLITALLKIDTRTKRENLDPDEALQHYLLTLANP